MRALGIKSCGRSRRSTKLNLVPAQDTTRIPSVREGIGISGVLLARRGRSTVSAVRAGRRHRVNLDWEQPDSRGLRLGNPFMDGLIR